MNTDEFLNELRKIRSTLFTIRVSDFIRSQDDATRKQFKDLKLEIMGIIEDLETAQLQQIANSLAANEQSFKDATASLRKELNDLDKAVRIINTISHLVSVVNQIAGVLL